jgi:hypothetical protein
MAYCDFTLAQVQATFGLAIAEDRRLFTALQPIQPSERLLTDLNENKPLAIAINSEKARSEFLIAPILAEVRRQTRYQASLFVCGLGCGVYSTEVKSAISPAP